MAWHLYVLPIVGGGTSHDDARRPKYVREAPELAGMPWSMMDYGSVPWCLMAADATAAQDTFLSAQADVRAIPDNLDNQIGGALTTVQNALETARIPSGWVSASTTWRELVRNVCGLFQFAQRYDAIAAETPGQERQLVLSTAALNLRINQLDTQTRQTLNATAASLGYSTAGITNTTLIRNALRLLADQWGAAPFYLGGLVL